MDLTETRMTNLFRQLGLDSSEQAISDFIKNHQLPTETSILDAPFWNEGQRQFLSEQIKIDAAWTTIIDQLNESLHEDAVKRGMLKK